MHRPSSPWKPPMGLIALDVVGIVLLVAGLTLHFAPGGGPMAGILPPSAALPLIVVGGGVMAIAVVLLLRSIAAAKRR